MIKNKEDIKTTINNNEYGVDQIDSLDGLEAVESCRLISTL